MGDCKCIDAKVTVSNEIEARLDCDCDQLATVTVGTVTIRDGTNDYEKLVHLPSIDGHTLKGDSTLPQIGVGLITEQDIDNIIFG